MNVSRINSSQNVNFKGRFLTKAANHIKNNSVHYACNVGCFTGSAIAGTLNSAEGIVTTKLSVDIVETVWQYLIKRGNAKGYASIDKPVTNSVCWLLKGEWKLFEKLFSK